MLLAIAKMNLLHNYNVVFDWSDNIKNWDSEFPYGITSEFRVALKEIEEYFQSTKTAHEDPVFDWDSSCGVVGVRYSKKTSVIESDHDMKVDTVIGR